MEVLSMMRIVWKKLVSNVRKMEGIYMNKKGKQSLVILLVVVIITVIVVLVIRKVGNTNNNSPMGQGKGRGGQDKVSSVRSVTAQEGVLKDYVITNGEVESQSAIEVFPSMSGKIYSINVMLGSHVRKGDIIAKVDPSEPGSNYALSPVDAPISGSIVTSPLKIGTKVSTTTAVTMIGDIENLQINCKIPERYVSVLKLGLKAEVTLEAYEGVIFNASIVRISPVVDKNTRTKEIILNFDKKDSRVNAGMFSKVKLYTSEYGGEVVLPKDALVTNGDKNYLFIVAQGNTVEKREALTGRVVDNYIQVLKGVKAGEKVVIEGMLSLSDGSKILDISENSNMSQGVNSKDGGQHGNK